MSTNITVPGVFSLRRESYMEHVAVWMKKRIMLTAQWGAGDS